MRPRGPTHAGIVRAYLADHPRSTAVEVASRLGISAASVYHNLRRLEARGEAVAESSDEPCRGGFGGRHPLQWSVVE